MITTKGVDHLGIPVNDVERAVKFYTEILWDDDRQAQPRRHGRSLEPRRFAPAIRWLVLFERPKPIEKYAVKEDGANALGLHRLAGRLRAGGEKNERLGREGLQHPDRRTPLGERFLLFLSGRQSLATLRPAAEIVIFGMKPFRVVGKPQPLLDGPGNSDWPRPLHG